jgi:hypothetical protein
VRGWKEGLTGFIGSTPRKNGDDIVMMDFVCCRLQLVVTRLVPTQFMLCPNNFFPALFRQVVLAVVAGITGDDDD